MPRIQLNKVHSPRQLGWRIALLLLLIISLVLGLITFLNYSNYRKNYLELNLTRHLTMARDLRQTVEAGLNIGLAPAANSQLRRAMPQLAGTQIDTRYIAIVDQNGLVMQHGDVPQQGETYWRGQTEHKEHNTESGYWHRNEGSVLQIGMPFSNNFNLRAGAVIIGYDMGITEAALAAMRHKLLLDLCYATLLSALILLGGCHWLTLRMRRELTALDQALAQGQVEPLADEVLGADVVAGIEHFMHEADQVSVHLTDIETHLKRQAP